MTHEEMSAMVASMTLIKSGGAVVGIEMDRDITVNETAWITRYLFRSHGVSMTTVRARSILANNGARA